MQLAEAHQAIADGVAAMRAACDSRAGADTRVEALKVCEQLSRQLDQLSVELVAGLDRDGVFTDRGYPSCARAVADLLGWDVGPAARRVRVAEHVCGRVALDGQVLPARLPDTAKVFTTGAVSVRHVEVIADALTSAAAGRLARRVWAAAEQQLAARARECSPRELTSFARDLVNLLDQDGPQPHDDQDPQPVNELYLLRTPGGAGGRITGVLDAPIFDAVLTTIEALAPLVPADQRSLAQRRADGLAELCHQRVGGRRPQLVVTIPLADLETRARHSMLDHGGPLTPAELRRIACDAHVLPVVLNGKGQPVDIGRASRVVPVHLRRALAARDHGCAFPGCDRPPGWCEAHHIQEWQHGGETALHNLVLMCRFHHRLVHHTEWVINTTRAGPEFTPPKWIDPTKTPHRKQSVRAS
jgi:5-methylcytosine-specific restriction protein A